MHLGKKPSRTVKEYPDSFYGQVRKKRILETVAAFVGGGIAAVEFVHHIIVNHYHFPEYSVDLTIAALFTGMVTTVTWQWFRAGKKKRTGVSKGDTVSSKYRILKELGHGGMGVVYMARDLRLDRFVALKFLPSELTRDPEARKRFVKEAQAAASLDHPNICTVHEIGEHEGQTYLAMACLEGKTLKEKIASGPLEVKEAVSIALETAEGLAGRSPFEGEGSQTVIYSLLKREPEPISKIRDDIPEALEHVVLTCLEKDPDKRYDSMEKFISALNSAAEEEKVSVSRPDKSIIVLPFEDISPGRDNEYFSDGLTEEIITDRGSRESDPSNSLYISKIGEIKGPFFSLRAAILQHPCH